MRILLWLGVLLAAALAASAQRGCVCPANYAPVCGASGRTHSNLCRLRCAGDSLRHTGACRGRS